MRIYAANSVFIEVTRRCNMCCAHCLRGDAESIDIQEKYIDAFLDSFEKGAYISSLTFTGGEISLNIPAIRYTLKAVKERGIAVGSFYMVTNGKAVDKMADLAMASLEWWNFSMTRMTIRVVFVSAAMISTKQSHMKVKVSLVA